MKHNWEYKRLGDVCSSKKLIKRASSSFSDEDIISYVDISTIDNKSNTVKNPSLVKFGDAPSRAQQVLKTNDILYSLVRPNLKNIALVTNCLNNMVGSSGFCVLRAEAVNPKLVLYYVLSNAFTRFILPKVTGASYPAVTEQDVKGAIIPVPPIDVQDKIVAELDKINEVIADNRKMLNKLNELQQSIFYEMFGDPISNPKGWETVNMVDVAKVKIGPFGSLLHKEDYIAKGVPLVNPIHMKNGFIHANENFSISVEKYNELTSYVLNTNDIVWSRRGDIGRCALVTSKENGFICGTGSLFCRFNIDINPQFSIWLCMSPSISSYLIKQAKGATMLNINCGIVENLPIILPPLPLQEEFAAKIEAIETQKANIEETIRKMQTLLDSRMDYWFN